MDTQQTVQELKSERVQEEIALVGGEPFITLHGTTAGDGTVGSAQASGLGEAGEEG